MEEDGVREDFEVGEEFEEFEEELRFLVENMVMEVFLDEGGDFLDLGQAFSTCFIVGFFDVVKGGFVPDVFFFDKGVVFEEEFDDEELVGGIESSCFDKRGIA